MAACAAERVSQHVCIHVCVTSNTSNSTETERMRKVPKSYPWSFQCVLSYAHPATHHPSLSLESLSMKNDQIYVSNFIAQFSAYISYTSYTTVICLFTLAQKHFAMCPLTTLVYALPLPPKARKEDEINVPVTLGVFRDGTQGKLNQ